MVDVEISLVKAFEWSLKDIVETDIEDLIPFIFRLGSKGAGEGSGEAQPARKKYCDEVNWL